MCRNLYPCRDLEIHADRLSHLAIQCKPSEFTEFSYCLRYIQQAKSMSEGTLHIRRQFASVGSFAIIDGYESFSWHAHVHFRQFASAKHLPWVALVSRHVKWKACLGHRKENCCQTQCIRIICVFPVLRFLKKRPPRRMRDINALKISDKRRNQWGIKLKASTGWRTKGVGLHFDNAEI